MTDSTPALTERLLEALAEAGLGHEAVADDERPRDAELPQVLARLGRGAGAEDDASAGERDGRGGAVRPGGPASLTWCALTATATRRGREAR